MKTETKERTRLEPVIVAYPVAPEPGVYVKGDITHPQHKRQRLSKTWHRVVQAQFADVATSDVQQSRWGRSAGYD